MAASAIASFPVISTLSMVLLPLRWFLLSIDFNCYIGTRLSTKGATDATFRFFYVNNVVPATVMLGRKGQHIFGTEGETQSTALTALSIDYYDSFWHVCAWSASVSNVRCGSSVRPSGESPRGWATGCLSHFVSVLCAAIGDVSDLHATANLL